MKYTNRSGKPADIARLDFHDFFGRLQDRTKAKVHEKEKGVMMIDKIKDRFCLSEREMNEIRQKLFQKEVDTFKELTERARAKPFQHPKKIEWHDTRINIR